MPIHSCRAVAAPGNEYLHVIWQGQDPDPVPVEQCTAGAPGGRQESLTGWEVERRHLRKEGRENLWSVVFRPTGDPKAPQPVLTWLRPSALVELRFMFAAGKVGPEHYTCPVDPLSLDGLADDVRNVVGDIEDLLGFPLTVAGADGGDGPAVPGTAVGAQAIVDAELRRVLGRKPSAEDVPGTLALLDRAIHKVTEDGVERWEVRSGGAYATQAHTGAGVTGRQASLAGLAHDTLEQVRPLVEQVEAVAPSLSNPALLDAHRASFLSSLTEAVTEAGVAGGPLEPRAEVLLDQCLGELAGLGRELRVLKKSKGRYVPTRRHVVTGADEDQFTSFLVILDRYVVFDDFYRGYLGEPRVARSRFKLSVSAARDRGRRFTELDAVIDVIAEAVRELDVALSSVGVDQEERDVIEVGKDGGTLADLMKWAQDFPEHEARPLVTSGGIRGAALLPARLDRLRRAFLPLQGLPSLNGGTRGLRQQRVRNAVDKLVRVLGDASTKAQQASTP